MSTVKRGCTWTTEFTSGRSRRMHECILTSLGRLSSRGPSTLKPSRLTTTMSSASVMESAGPRPLMMNRSGWPGIRRLTCPRSIVGPSARPISASHTVGQRHLVHQVIKVGHHISPRLADSLHCATGSGGMLPSSNFGLTGPQGRERDASQWRPGRRGRRGARGRRGTRGRRSGG